MKTGTGPEESQIDRSRYVTIYTTSIAILGAAVVVYAFTQHPRDVSSLALFAFLAGITEAFGVELFSSSHSRVSVSNIIAVASIFLFGPMAGVIVQLMTGLTAALAASWTNKPLISKGQASFFQRSAFNAGMLVISIAAGGTVYPLVGGTAGTVFNLSNLVPIILVVTVNATVNLLLLSIVISLQTSQSIIHIWQRDFQWSIPIGLAGGVIGGGALSMAYEMFGLLGLAVFFLPIFLINYSFRLYVANTKDYVNKLEEMNTTLDEANLGLLEALGRVIDAYDVYTYGHSAQVSVYAREIAQKMNLSPEIVSDITRAALIHDIGKVGIKESIVSKPGPLSPEERMIINRHPEIGAGIISEMKGLQNLVPLVKHHHERWDGFGYPSHLSGEDIPLGARVLTLADSIDAMGSDRPYHPPMSFENIRTEIVRCSGKQFDPDVVQAFLLICEEKGEEFLRNSATVVAGAIKEEGFILVDHQTPYLKKGMITKDSE